MEIKIAAAFGERLVTDLNLCLPKTVFAQNMVEPRELQRARDDSGSSQNRCQTLGGLPQVKQNSVITKNEEDFRAASDDRQKQHIASFFPRVDSNGKATT